MPNSLLAQIGQRFTRIKISASWLFGTTFEATNNQRGLTMLAINVLRRGRSAGLNRDRKSTRLNSSHMSISYAVFCLKKKKKKTSGRYEALVQGGTGKLL